MVERFSRSGGCLVVSDFLFRIKTKKDKLVFTNKNYQEIQPVSYCLEGANIPRLCHGCFRAPPPFLENCAIIWVWFKAPGSSGY